jgi:hypothetical protein
MNPEAILTREAMTQGAITYTNQENTENNQLVLLRNGLKRLIQQEISV